MGDDHTVVRQGLRKIIEERPEWEVVGEASDGREAVKQVLDAPAGRRRAHMVLLLNEDDTAKNPLGLDPREVFEDMKIRIDVAGEPPSAVSTRG